MRASGAAMGKFGKSQSKGVMLASWGNKNYYKGKRVQKAGVTTRKGGFRLVDAKMPLWEVPDLTGCDLKPYVSRKTPLVSVPPPAFLSDEEIRVLFQAQLREAGLAESKQ